MQFSWLADFDMLIFVQQTVHNYKQKLKLLRNSTSLEAKKLHLLITNTVLFYYMAFAIEIMFWGHLSSPKWHIYLFYNEYTKLQLSELMSKDFLNW